MNDATYYCLGIQKVTETLWKHLRSYYEKNVVPTTQHGADFASI